MKTHFLRLSYYVCVMLFILAALLVLAQLWFRLFDTSLFCKLIVTDGILLATWLILAFVVKERQDSKKLHNDREL